MKFQFKSALAGAVFACASFAALPAANATVFQIDDVIDGTGITGFSSSLFHTAQPNVMQGTSLLNFTGWAVSGWYDNVTGVLTATIGAGASSFSINSVAGQGFFFDSNGWLDGNNGFAAFDVDFTTPPAGLYDATMSFTDGDQCCSSTGNNQEPNSFASADGGITNFVMSLWGATDYPNWGYDSGNSNRYGVDIRLKMSATNLSTIPIPIPPSVLLFASGMLGLGLLAARRRRRA